MAPRSPEFRPFAPDDAELLRRHAAAGRDACEYAPTNLVIWRDFDRATCAVVDGSFCIRLAPPTEPAFLLEPIGGIDPLTAALFCAEETPRFSRISEGFAAALAARGFLVGETPEHHDYLYETRELAALSGRRFDGKRNHIKRLARLDPDHRLVGLSKNDAAAALALFDRWAQAKRGQGGVWEELPDLALACQRRALERAFEGYEELGLLGAGLVANGELAGFVIGSCMRDDLACLHLSYTHPKLPGVFPALLQASCRTIFAKFAQVNLEQDLGLPGLRKTKQSYYPARMERKFEARKPLAKGRPIR